MTPFLISDSGGFQETDSAEGERGSHLTRRGGAEGSEIWRMTLDRRYFISIFNRFKRLRLIDRWKHCADVLNFLARSFLSSLSYWDLIRLEKSREKLIKMNALIRGPGGWFYSFKRRAREKERDYGRDGRKMTYFLPLWRQYSLMKRARDQSCWRH